MYEQDYHITVVATNLSHPVGHIYHTPDWDLCGEFVRDALPYNLQGLSSKFRCGCIGTTGNFFERIYSTNFIKELQQKIK